MFPVIESWCVPSLVRSRMVKNRCFLACCAGAAGNSRIHRVFAWIRETVGASEDCQASRWVLRCSRTAALLHLCIAPSCSPNSTKGISEHVAYFVPYLCHTQGTSPTQRRASPHPLAPRARSASTTRHSRPSRAPRMTPPARQQPKAATGSRSALGRQRDAHSHSWVPRLIEPSCCTAALLHPSSWPHLGESPPHSSATPLRARAQRAPARCAACSLLAPRRRARWMGPCW